MASFPIVALVLAAALPTRALGQHSMSDLSALVGCWKGGTGAVDMREQWSDSDGGAMLGTTRYLREGVLVDWEFARILQSDSAIVLWPYPKGEQSPRGFSLVETGSDLVFENLEHDFPVRIIYRVVDSDHLAPRIEGPDGEGRGWELRRVPCSGG